jgi:hypothetical protein
MLNLALRLEQRHGHGHGEVEAAHAAEPGGGAMGHGDAQTQVGLLLQLGRQAIGLTTEQQPVVVVEAVIPEAWRGR